MADGGVMQSKSDFTVCENHSNQKVEMFCDKHSALCCHKCLWEKHRYCSPEPIKVTDAAKKFQAEKSEFINQLYNCLDSTNNEIKVLTKQIQTMERSEESILAHFETFKRNAWAHLSNLVKEDSIKEQLLASKKPVEEMLIRTERKKQMLEETMKTILNPLPDNNPPYTVSVFLRCNRLINSRVPIPEKELKPPVFKVTTAVENFFKCTTAWTISTDEGISDIDGSRLILPDADNCDVVIYQRKKEPVFRRILKIFKFHSNTKTTRNVKDPEEVTDTRYDTWTWQPNQASAPDFKITDQPLRTKLKSTPADEACEAITDESWEPTRFADLEENHFDYRDYPDFKDINWFHGCLPRENAEKRLSSNGDFLVRARKEGDEIVYIISVHWNNNVKHIKYKSENAFWKQPFIPLMRIIDNNQPITGAGVMLRTSVSKEKWEIRNDDIRIQNKIDKGVFGDIHKGFFKLADKQVRLNLASDDLSEDEMKCFLREAEILWHFDHPNIIRCLGIAMDLNPVMAVMQNLTGDSLLTALQTRGPSFDAGRKLAMCIDVASALLYIQERDCIHRNIAAKSCLLGDEDTVKLADFSMCSQIDPLRSKPIPVSVKWTAPEALGSADIQASSCLQSDIWSFGILLWEVYSLGTDPYPDKTDQETKDHILQGYRMPPPKEMPPTLQEMMTNCWKEEPNKRPNITHILFWLKFARKSTVC